MNYNILTTGESLKKTYDALATKGYKVELVKTGFDALSKIKEIIPEGATIMNGSSTTLSQIGFVDVLKNKEHKWNNLHDKVLNEADPDLQAELRKQVVHSEYYLGSVHALTEDGDMLIASNSGSQLPSIVYTSTHLVFVVGTQKIVPNLEEAFNRLEQYVVPLEDKRALEAYGVNTQVNKILLIKGENPHMGRTIHIILVEEILGF